VLKDTEIIARTNSETQKIADAVNQLAYLGEDSKETIPVFLPEKSAIYCLQNGLRFEATLTQTPFPTQCPQGVCTKNFESVLQIQCAFTSIRGPTKERIILIKNANSITVGLEGIE